MSSAADGPAAVATSRRAIAEPAHLQACRQPCGTASDRNVIPVCSVPDDFFAAGKQELDRPRRRTGSLDLPRRTQRLGLPAVGESEPDPVRAQPVFLQCYCIIEKLADYARVKGPAFTLRHEFGHRV